MCIILLITSYIWRERQLYIVKQDPYIDYRLPQWKYQAFRSSSLLVA